MSKRCDHSSGPNITDGIKRSTRSYNDANNTSKPIRSCTGWGLPSPRHCYRGWWSLTPPFHPYPETSSGRFTFCCTFHRSS